MNLIDWNNKEDVIKEISSDPLSLEDVSEELQNDKELLLLLEKNNGNAMKFYAEWYEERMKVLEAYREQEIIQNSLDEVVLTKIKTKKF